MATTLLTAEKPIQHDDELTDEQIEALLARATARLHEKSKQLATTSSKPQSLTFPKLDAGKLEQPYVSSKGDITIVDSARLLDQKHRKKAEGARKVEDPITTMKAAEEVRWLRFSLFPGNEEINPNFLILSGLRAPFWLSFRTTESFIFIVTLSHHSSHTLCIVTTYGAVTDSPTEEEGHRWQSLVRSAQD